MLASRSSKRRSPSPVRLSISPSGRANPMTSSLSGCTPRRATACDRLPISSGRPYSELLTTRSSSRREGRVRLDRDRTVRGRRYAARRSTGAAPWPPKGAYRAGRLVRRRWRVSGSRQRAWWSADWCSNALQNVAHRSNAGGRQRCQHRRRNRSWRSDRNSCGAPLAATVDCATHARRSIVPQGRTDAAPNAVRRSHAGFPGRVAFRYGRHADA